MISFQKVGVAFVLGIGIPLGYFIASRTKEELKDGYKYFKVLLLALFFLIIYLSSSKFFAEYISILIALASSLVIIFLPKRFNEPIALILCAGSVSLTRYFVESASLVFLYNLTFGSIVYGNKKKLVIYTIIFILVSIISHLVF